MIVVCDYVVHETKLTESNSVSFFVRRNECRYSMVEQDRSIPSVPGTVLVSPKKEMLQTSAQDFGKKEDQVRAAIVTQPPCGGKEDKCRSPLFTAKGYVYTNDQWHPDEVVVLPTRKHGDIYSRHQGLLETDALMNKHVLIVGQGSGGGGISVGLVQSGVGNIAIVDPEHVEPCNVSRHVLGLSQVGRYKTLAMADYIHDKNPLAQVSTLEKHVTWDNIEMIEDLIQAQDLVIGATGETECNRILNKLCVQYKVPLIIAGAYCRAYGGQVMLIRPGITPCYVCSLNSRPGQSQDREVSSTADAAVGAYADHEVPIEPGLASDIQPICNLAVKRAILELLRGTETSLMSLYKDLDDVPLHFWINRREKDTRYENLKPLQCDINGIHVLRWYGLPVPKDAACPVCGDDRGWAQEFGVTVTSQDTDYFAGNPRRADNDG